jgi:hypothetical protein
VTDKTSLLPEQLEDGLFAIPSLPDAPSEGAAPGTSKQGRRGKGRRGSKDAAAAAEGAPGGSSGGLLQAGGREEVELALEGLHRHDLELMWVRLAAVGWQAGVQQPTLSSPMRAAGAQH